MFWNIFLFLSGLQSSPESRIHRGWEKSSSAHSIITQVHFPFSVLIFPFPWAALGGSLVFKGMCQCSSTWSLFKAYGLITTRQKGPWFPVLSANRGDHVCKCDCKVRWAEDWFTFRDVNGVFQAPVTQRGTQVAYYSSSLFPAPFWPVLPTQVTQTAPSSTQCQKHGCVWNLLFSFLLFQTTRALSFGIVWWTDDTTRSYCVPIAQPGRQ